MSGTYPNLLAGGINNENAFAPFELWAGESDLVTSQGTAGANLAQFTVVARGATGGQIVAWAPAATDSSKIAIGFLAQPAVLNGPAVYYTGGVPNHKALIWPVGVDTLDARKAAFDGTNITISALL
jgi:hypothetical protein